VYILLDFWRADLNKAMAIEQLEKIRLQFLSESRQGLSARQQNEGRLSNEVRQNQLAECPKGIWGIPPTAPALNNLKDNEISENSTNEIISVSELPQPAPKQLPKTPNRKSLREVRKDLYSRTRSNRPKKRKPRGYTPKMTGRSISLNKASLDRRAESRRHEASRRNLLQRAATTTPRVPRPKRNIHSSPCKRAKITFPNTFPDLEELITPKTPIHRPAFSPRRGSSALNAPTHRFKKQLAHRENPRNHPPWIHPGNGISRQIMTADTQKHSRRSGNGKLSQDIADAKERGELPSETWPSRSKYDIPSWPCNRFAKTRDPQQLKTTRRIFPALSPESNKRKKSRTIRLKAKIMCPADFVRLSFPALES